MTRIIAILACAAPLAVAAASDGSLRGAKVAQGKGENHRFLTGDDDGAGMGPTPTTTYDGWDDPSLDSEDDLHPDTQEEGTYTHVGCFSDSKENRVLGHMMWDENMTAKMCHIHCNVRGAFYMATQYGRECWCSREQDLDYHSVDIGVCDMECSGDPTESCGGYDAFDLYELVWPAESTDPEYMDCYSDRKEDRVMSDKIVDSRMTQAACRSHCDGVGAMYYGTQYGNECWCGSSEVFADYDKHGEGTCHMPCSGDASVACGGYNAFSLYRFMDAEMPVDPANPVAPTPAAPTPAPQKVPTPTPVRAPTEAPVKAPTPHPVAAPTEAPVKAPTPHPVAAPTEAPVKAPTPRPVAAPTEHPVAAPTEHPVAAPTPSPVKPVAEPTPAPVKEPTPSPEPEPTPSPVPKPTEAPVKAPTPSPEPAPTPSPVKPPTPAPVKPEPESDDGGGGGGGGEGSFDDTLYTGEGTYYGATTAGNCAFGSNIPSMYDGMIAVALNEPQYGDSLMCGACIEGEGTGPGSGGDPIGKFKAYVTDKCPECKTGDLDFSESGDGRWDIEWKFVPCSAGSDTPSFIFEGSHEYYWKLQPRGTPTPVLELSVNGAKGERADDNFFIVTEGVPFYGKQDVVTKTIGGTTHEQDVAI